MPARLGELQRGSALAGEALVGANTVLKITFSNLHGLSRNFSVVRLYLLININVGAG